jgi:malonyl CoA-acyl carrier protein transacylase
MESTGLDVNRGSDRGLSGRRDTSFCESGSRPVGAEVFAVAAGTRAELVGTLHTFSREIRTGSSDLRSTATRLGQAALGEHRVAVVATDLADLCEKLTQAATRIAESNRSHLRVRGSFSYGNGPRTGKLAIVFPGQGSQFPNMLADLLQVRPSARRWFECLDAVYQRAGAGLPSDALGGDENLFSLSTGAQLGLVASLALYESITAMGIEGECFVGHSNGEHAALIASGALAFPSVEAACGFIGAVGLESRSIPPPPIAQGVLAVTGNNRAAVEEAIREGNGTLFLSVDNCPMQMLLAGTEKALEVAAHRLRAQGMVCVKMPFSWAHHTSLFRGWSELLWRHYCEIPVRPPQSKVYCCATRQPYPSEPETIRRMLAEQWSAPVHFRETIEAMYESGVRIFIEAGPDNRLVPFIADTLRGRPYLALAASSRDHTDFDELAMLAAELFAAGVPIRWGFFHPTSRQTVPDAISIDAIQRAAIEEQRSIVRLAHRIDEHIATKVQSLTSPSQRRALNAPSNFFLGKTQPTADGFMAVRRHSVEEEAYLLDHALGRPDRGSGSPLPVMAFTEVLAIAAEAAAQISSRVGVASLRLHRWLALDIGTLTLETVVDLRSKTISIFVLSGDGTRQLGANATLTDRSEAAAFPPVNIDKSEPLISSWSVQRFYAEYAFHGRSFQGLRRVLRLTAAGVEAELCSTVLSGLASISLHCDPALLDCAGQLVALWLLETTGEVVGAFPFAAGELSILSPAPAPGTRLLCRVSIRRVTFATTEADVDFLFLDGTVLARLRGLQQRLVQFPSGFDDLLFGEGPLSSSPSLAMAGTAEGQRFLARDGAIWARALAHAALSRQAWRDWWNPAEEPLTLSQNLAARLADQAP